MVTGIATCIGGDSKDGVWLEFILLLRPKIILRPLRQRSGFLMVSRYCGLDPFPFQQFVSMISLPLIRARGRCRPCLALYMLVGIR